MALIIATTKTMDFQGKRIVITGGGSGIGLELATRFAERGANVIITGRNLDKLKAAAEGNANLTPFVCDVSKDEDMIKLRDAMEKEGGIDMLVNNAGVMHKYDVKDANYPIANNFQEVDIDINGVIRGVHYFLPMLMKRKEAVIMNVSSALAYIPMASAPVLCGAKAFVHSYTQSLRIQLRNTNVRVVEILPPGVETPMTMDDDGFDKMPLKDFGDAVMKSFQAGVNEITPGLSWQLWLLSRVAPNFILKQLNKNVK